MVDYVTTKTQVVFIGCIRKPGKWILSNNAEVLNQHVCFPDLEASHALSPSQIIPNPFKSFPLIPFIIFHIPCMSETIWWLSFLDWQNLLSIIPSSSFHVEENVGYSSFLFLKKNLLGSPGGAAVWRRLPPGVWSWRPRIESHIGLPAWGLLLPLPVSLPLSFSLSVSHE